MKSLSFNLSSISVKLFTDQSVLRFSGLMVNDLSVYRKIRGVAASIKSIRRMCSIA